VGEKEYLGLLCTEMPEARFEDLIVVKDPTFPCTVAIDPKLLSFLKPGTLLISGVTCSHPEPVGAEVVGNNVILRSKVDALPEGATITIRVSGVRKDQPMRWPRFTEQQADRNTLFWAQATNG
jgi:hypothetical protein